MKVSRMNQTMTLARHAGFTLVEVMVAMAIGMMVILGLVFAFDANRENFRFNNQMLQLQDSGRLVTDAIISDLRMAGDIGCVRSSMDQGQTFAELVDNVEVNGAFTNDHLGAADSELGEFEFNSTNLVQALVWKKGAIKTGGDDVSALGIFAIPVDMKVTGAEANNAILWSDCDASKVTLDGDPPAGFNPSYRVTTGYRIYYHEPSSGGARLSIIDPSMSSHQTILNNVEHFAVCFGVDDGVAGGGSMEGRVSRWVSGTATTPSAVELQQTVAVQVQMIVASDPQGEGTSGRVLAAKPNAKTYDFCDGTDFTTHNDGGDRRLYKFFSSTAVLRNKVANGYGESGGWLPAP